MEAENKRTIPVQAKECILNQLQLIQDAGNSLKGQSGEDAVYQLRQLTDALAMLLKSIPEWIELR